MKHVFTLVALALMSIGLAQVPEYVPADGLVAWYPLNSTSEDAGPGGFDMCATEISFVEGRWGDVNGAYSSTYGGQVLSSCAAEGEWNDEITYSMWFNPADLTVDPYPSNWFALLTMNGYSQNALGALLSIQGASPCLPTQCLIRPHWPSDQGFGECAEVFSNEWYHLCVTGNHDSSYTYLNGQMILSSIHDDGTDFSEVPFGWTLGASTVSHTYHFKGAFDDVGIWNRALSQDEVMTLFNAPAPASGCTDESACNYSSDAQIDDGSCVSCVVATAFCGEGTTWDAETLTCIVANPSDSNFDGCVQLNDLLDLLSAYGDCGVEESPWLCGDPFDYQGYDYATVQIGEQCWFAENLRSENYLNGDEIPAGLSDSDWYSTTSGATAVYEESSSNLEMYGRLYNWFAVDDNRGLCPSGWQVPLDGQWTVLTDFLGGESMSGDKMKTTFGWSDDGNGSDLSGFSGLPGGLRGSYGNFGSAGLIGIWWSASQAGSGAWDRVLSSANQSVYRGGNPKIEGFSVRCIQTSE